MIPTTSFLAPRPFRLALLLTWYFPLASLSAADFVVTRYDDPAPDGCAVGDCSLREATLAANAAADADRILLSAGTYELTIPGTAGVDPATGDLGLTEPVELAGAGAGLTRIDANNLSRAVTVLLTSGQAIVRALAIAGGDFPTTGTAGVAIAGSAATLENVEIVGVGVGVNDSAVELVGGSLTLRGSLISGTSGAGLVVLAGTALVENSTLTGNGSFEVRAGGTGSLSLTHSTVSDPAGSGAEVSVSGTAALSLENSLVAGNCSATSGTLLSLGGNLESPGATCPFNQTLDQQNVPNANLAALGDNGGPTRTLAPLPGSLAIDASSDANCKPVDQRGILRPQDGDGIGGAHCDAGALERSVARPLTPLFLDGFLQGDGDAWSFTVP